MSDITETDPNLQLCEAKAIIFEKNQKLQENDAEIERLKQENEGLQIQNLNRNQQDQLDQKVTRLEQDLANSKIENLQLNKRLELLELAVKQKVEKVDQSPDQMFVSFASKVDNLSKRLEILELAVKQKVEKVDQSPGQIFVSKADNLNKRLNTLELTVNQNVLQLEQNLTASKNINVELNNRLSFIEVQFNDMMNPLHLHLNPSELEKLRKQQILIDHRSHVVNNLAAQSKIEKKNETDQNTSVLILGGNGFLDTIYLLDSKALSWKELRITLPIGMRYFGAVVLNEELYIFGGVSKDVYQPIISGCYKLPIDENWMELASLNQRRYDISSSSLVYKGDIWVIGGSGASGVHLNSVEKYDISQDKWTYMPELIIGRSNAAAAVFKDHIFVTGGWNEKNLKSVEMFNPLLQKWILFCDLPIEVYAHTMLINNSILSIFGGIPSLNSVWEMDIEDPEKKWTEKKSFNNPRMYFGIGQLSNGIIVFGDAGYQKSGGTSEIFDGNEWIDGPKLPQYLSQFAYTSITRSLEETFLAKLWSQEFPYLQQNWYS